MDEKQIRVDENKITEINNALASESGLSSSSQLTQKIPSYKINDPEEEEETFSSNVSDLDEEPSNCQIQ